MIDNFVIASTKPWNVTLAERLKKRTGQNFILISEKNALNVRFLEEYSPSFVFLPHWSYQISQNIWQNYPCVIFHMTDLPFGRGGSPLQNLIMMGLKSTVISALRCVKELDAGPIYLKKHLDLSGSAQEIFFRADQIIEEMIIDIIHNDIHPIEQVGDPVIFKRRKPHESNLKELKSMQQVYDHIRMLDAEGYPHAFIETEFFRFEFVQAQLQEDQVEAKVLIKRNAFLER